MSLYICIRLISLYVYRLFTYLYNYYNTCPWCDEEGVAEFSGLTAPLSLWLSSRTWNPHLQELLILLWITGPCQAYVVNHLGRVTWKFYSSEGQPSDGLFQYRAAAFQMYSLVCKAISLIGSGPTLLKYHLILITSAKNLFLNKFTLTGTQIRTSSHLWMGTRFNPYDFSFFVWVKPNFYNLYSQPKTLL